MKMIMKGVPMMAKTEELRKVIAATLSEVCPRVYYEEAHDKEKFPYIVYELNNIDLGDIVRDDLIMSVDIWDKSVNPKEAERIADALEDLLNAANIPSDTVLPTFYRVSRQTIYDPDKAIRHKQLKFQIQNYYIGA